VLFKPADFIGFHTVTDKARVSLSLRRAKESAALFPGLPTEKRSG
jgi:hypothetical protein